MPSRRTTSEKGSSDLSIAPLGRDREAKVPGGWNERAEWDEMNRDRDALRASDKADRKAWGIDTDKAAFGTKPIAVPQRMRTV